MSNKLRKVEENVLIPRYMEYKITHELCAPEAKDFAMCAEEKGFKVVVDCKPILAKFAECTNRWMRDDEFKKQMTEDYLTKREKFRTTGEAEKSPFGRLHPK